jgi:hypothetical protein
MQSSIAVGEIVAFLLSVAVLAAAIVQGDGLEAGAAGVVFGALGSAVILRVLGDAGLRRR